jgi:starch synthase
MKKMLKIFYIAPEVAPYVKTYHLAEVTGAFPKALKEMGHDIRVMMPNYKRINPRKYVLRDVIRLKDMNVPFGKREILVSAKSAFLPNSKVQIYFLDNKDYFGRDGIYSELKKGTNFKDNDERFILFCKGCIETLRMLHWQPDVIHCNDWQCGFMPAYIKKVLAKDTFLNQTRVVYSIYDLQNEACIQPATLEKTGIPPDIFGPEEIEKDGSINLLKSALLHSDLVFVESKEKLASSEAVSENIKNILQLPGIKLTELGSGIDNSVWNPDSDRYLKSTYDIESVSEKKENKKSLFEKLELEYSPETPLVYMSTLPGDHKDVNSILRFIPDIIGMGFHFVILNQNAKNKAKTLAALNEKYPKKFLVKEKYDESFAHLLMAGADFYLAPTWEEPMISSHLIGLKYGTIPVVKDEKGFSDTIKDYSKSSKNATGFIFNSADNSDILNTLKTALGLYHDEKKWELLIKNAMKQDYSWHSVSPKYIQNLSQLF